ncbi:efflux RND transporter periplasmic adaptor subunit [Pendulispora rubella]|uniref:Efflux RND transporter periplasmic adaptor subunit n=1 Tax=Pendulispora rubella TaxID=2741070 RepID=A0ABZ2LBI7_9BACT
MHPFRAVAFLFALLLIGCHGRGEAKSKVTHERRPDGSLILSGESAAYVRVEPASPACLEHSRSLVAHVSYDERHVAKMGPPVGGRVAKINVVTGDTVKAGTVLLTIHAPDIASAQAAVSNSHSARLLAEKVAARAALLVKEGAGSEAEKQQADAALVQAQTEEQRATAALAALGGAHGTSDYALRSPIDGTVVERNVTVGTAVSADQETPLVTVADLATVWVLADVYERDLPQVHVGDATTVQMLAYPDRKLEGQITNVGEIVDPQTRSARARVELPNPDRSLRPGMFARVEVRGNTSAAAEVPTSALLARRDQFFVFLKNSDGSYGQHEVHIGEQHGEHTTIVSGIGSGDKVVTEGAILLDAESNEAL